MVVGEPSGTFHDLPVCYALVTNRALAPTFRAYGAGIGPWILVEVGQGTTVSIAKIHTFSDVVVVQR